MSMIRHLFRLCVLLGVLPPVCAQSIYMKHYTINDGLASNHVYMCDQDEQGYLWIATTSGLCRFDGKSFKNYTFEKGLLSNDILWVVCDHQGYVWANTFSANPPLARIRNDSIETFRNSPLLSSLTAYSLINTDGGLFSKRHKAVYLKGESYLTCIIKDWKPAIKYLRNVINYPVETEDGRIYVSDKEQLCQVVDTNILPLQHLEKGPYSPAKIMRYYNGLLYVVSERCIDLYRYTQNHFVFYKRKVFSENVNTLYCDSLGAWITFTSRRGAWLYKDHTFTTEPRKVNIPGIINFFNSDREGGLWVSTIDNGLFYLPQPGIISYSTGDGLSSSLVSAIEPLSENECWLGFNNGKAQRVTLNGDKLLLEETITPLVKQAENNFITDITVGENGTVYFMSRQGLVLLDQGRPNTLMRKGGGKYVSVINDTAVGAGIAGCYHIYHTRTGKFSPYHLGRVYAQAFDSNQVLWLGGINGLYQLPLPSAGKEHPDSVRIAVLNNIKINKLVLKEDYLWVGTQNQGLYLMKHDSIIARFTKETLPGLPSDNIKALAVRNNEIWVGTNWGLMHGRFDYAKKQFTSTIMMDHHDGLLSPDINTIRVKGSKVFIGTYDGFTVLDHIPHSRLYYTIGDLSVTELATGTRYKTGPVQMPYDTKGFEVSFNAVSLKYKSEIAYRYRLEPFDKEWRTTPNNLVQYTNIPPGAYRFYVVAYDNRGNQSRHPDCISITIEPKYWQTWWFHLLTIVAITAFVLILFFLFYRYQKRKTQERIRQGRIIAKARLHALRAQLKPHFIYNSLNAIKDYIYSNKNDDAADLLQGFAGLIRKGLHLADQDFVSIKEEAEFTSRYLQLEQKKCDACFDYAITVAANLSPVLIPSLITQPFIENAVVHGIKSKPGQKGHIEISYTAKGNDITCTISDNGIGIIRSAELKKHYHKISKGVSISDDRISYFRIASDIEIRLSVRDKATIDPAATGTLVTITIINGLQNIKYDL